MEKPMKLFVLGLLSSLFAFSAQAAIKTKEVVYKVGDAEFTGYLAYDDAVSGKRPGVLVVHEWWGHNAYARKRAEMLAELGYTALALDMYGTGKLAEHPKDAKALASVVREFSVAQARFNKAHELLKNEPTVDASKTAAIGYCMGGSIVLNMARSGADLDGVVSFHGSLGNRVPAEPGNVKAKIRVYNGAADPFVKPEHLAAFEAELKAAGADYEIKNYDGVKHSFTNPDADVYGPKFKLPLAYDKAADEDSWAGTQAFFKEIF
jgi:dienelactone hydrolase